MPDSASTSAPPNTNKRVLAIVVHPDKNSYTFGVLNAALAPLREANCEIDILDLHAEGFDPRFNLQDVAHFKLEGEPDETVRGHQRRVDRADLLVFVFPIYWWSLPGMLKGWIDRVFTGMWAYEFTAERSKGLLKDRPTLLLALGGSTAKTFAKYTYDKAMSAQIDIGIFGYCGLRDVQLELLLDDDVAEEREKHLTRAGQLAKGLLDPTRKPRETVSSDRPNP